MHKVTYIRYNDNSLVVRLDGVHYHFNEDKETIDHLIRNLKGIKLGHDTAYDSFMTYVNPTLAYDIPEEFERDEFNNIVLKGTDVPVPQDLLEFMFEYLEENGNNIEPFVRFWQLCMMNPNVQAREDFFRYVKEYGVSITDFGYAILYKAVNKKRSQGMAQFSEFVSESYLKLKRNKKSPSNYDVYIVTNNDNFVSYQLSTHSGKAPTVDEGYDVEKWDNLEALYKRISIVDKENHTIYTPWNKGDYGQEVKIGHPVTMPREECDPDISASCSYGLHVGSFDYVKSFGSGLDTILAVLVNPKNIVALPEHDNSKIRTCEYYPYAVIERNNSTGEWREIETKYFEEDYADYEIEELIDLNSEEESIESNRLLYLYDSV